MEARDLLGNAIFNGVGNVITGTPEIVNDFVRKAIGAGPIPISKDWMPKFGLTYQEERTVNRYESEVRYIGKRLVEKMYDFEVCFVTSNYGGEPYYSWKIKIDNEDVSLYYKLEFIHQLQNIFHALTGEELTLIKK